MTQGRTPERGADWSKYLKSPDLNALLHGMDPQILKELKKIVPWGVERILNRFGWQHLPELELPIGEGELVVSPDESIVGFQPEGAVAGLCGIAISPGETSAVSLARARVVRPEGASHYQVNVPEGPYQLVLVAPQPWTDSRTQEIVFYTACVMVASEENKGNGTVKGILTAFGRDQRPIRWMVLNEWSQPGVLRHAYRLVPGIVFPEEPGETEATVLKLHSLASERGVEMPEGVVSGSGLIAARFFENRIGGTNSRESGSGRLVPNSLLELYAAPVKTFGLDGLTVFEQGTTRAFNIERGGISKSVGSTVLLSVATIPGSEVALVGIEGVVIKEHRRPTDEYPALQALARWGISEATRLVSETQ